MLESAKGCYSWCALACWTVSGRSGSPARRRSTTCWASWARTCWPPSAASPPASFGYHRARTLALAHSEHLGHLVGVNGFFAALAARARPDAALAAWWSERRCTQRWGHLVRPDGFGRWTEAGRAVEFFLEYDTGSETVARVVGKLGGYTDLATGCRVRPAADQLRWRGWAMV